MSLLCGALILVAILESATNEGDSGKLEENTGHLTFTYLRRHLAGCDVNFFTFTVKFGSGDS